MITFGLTGGIACGKSTVTKTFRRYNIPMIDADIVARQVVEPGSKGLDQMINHFGKEYLNQDGMLDRPKLAKLVFGNQDRLNEVNSIMLPLIQQEVALQFQKYHQDGHGMVGYDAALICEMGDVEKYRPLIVVSCPRDTQLARLMSRNSLTRDEAVARIEVQMALEQKVALADYVIDTSGTIESSIAQTEVIINKLLTLLKE
jgi:dephospho-CoA kinase